jgi:hypothetical protein
MTDRTNIAALIDEIERYLAAVEAFRAAGCEPTWRTDLRSAGREDRCIR